MRFPLLFFSSIFLTLAIGLIVGSVLEWWWLPALQWNARTAGQFTMITIATLVGLILHVRRQLGNVGIISAAVLIPLITFLFLVPYVGLWSLGTAPESSVVFWSSNSMGRTLVVGSALFIFLSIGVAVGVRFSSTPFRTRPRLADGAVRDWERISVLLSWMSLVVLLAFSVVLGPMLFSRSYADTIFRLHEGPVFGLFLLAELFARASIVSWALVVAVSGKPIWKSRAVILPLIVYLLFVFSQGDRGSLFTTCVLLAVAHPGLWRKQAVLRLTLVSILGLTLISALRYARYSEERTVQATVREAFDARHSIGVLDALENMGGSITVLNRTVSIIEQGEEHWHGRSYLYALIRLLPLADARAVLGKVSNADLWITERTDPQRASVGGGLGFAFLAEIYLNWGLPLGIPLIIAIGIALGVVSRGWAATNGRAMVLPHLIVVYAGLTMVRGTVATGSRYVFYTLMIILTAEFVQRTLVTFRSQRIY